MFIEISNRPGQFFQIDEDDLPLLERYKWALGWGGYIGRGQRRRKLRKCCRAILLHRHILGLTHGDGKIGDHINGDKLDYRRDNLRVVSRIGNKQNVHGLYRNNTTGYRGVMVEKRYKNLSYRAGARANGKLFKGRTFDNAKDAGEEAARMRDSLGFLTAMR